MVRSTLDEMRRRWNYWPNLIRRRMNEDIERWVRLKEARPIGTPPEERP